MANIERSNSDSKNSKRSVLTGESAITLSVSGVPEEQLWVSGRRGMKSVQQSSAACELMS